MKLQPTRNCPRCGKPVVRAAMIYNCKTCGMFDPARYQWPEKEPSTVIGPSQRQYGGVRDEREPGLDVHGRPIPLDKLIK